MTTTTPRPGWPWRDPLVMALAAIALIKIALLLVVMATGIATLRRALRRQ